MDTREYRTKIEIKLKPVWYKDPPRIRIGIEELHEYTLETETTFVYEAIGNTPVTLTLEFYNKQDSDTINGHDKAVIVEQIWLNDITDSKFVWLGEYRPQYPEPWRSEQQAQGQIWDDCLVGHRYLGWNGSWSLTVGVPIFSWIHQTLGLGWRYE